MQGCKVYNIKPCPFCQNSETLLSNPFLNDGISNSYTVKICVFCNHCGAHGPYLKAELANSDEDYVTSLTKAKKEAIIAWNNAWRD